jgi:hypothetical protein
MKSASLGGIELDIAIGGQTGADTRLYASQQTLLYRSFAPVVLVLKVLLNQQDLDMPFTGKSDTYCLIVHQYKDNSIFAIVFHLSQVDWVVTSSMYSWHTIFNSTCLWVDRMNAVKYCSAFYFVMEVAESLEIIVFIRKHGLPFVKMMSLKRVRQFFATAATIMKQGVSHVVAASVVPTFPMYTNWRSVCIYLDVPGRGFGIVYEKARATTLTKINTSNQFRSWRNLSTHTRWISNVKGTFPKQEEQ